MRHSLRAGIVLFLATVALTGGCAYFNLFYNAKDSFEEAERIGRDVDPRNQPTSQQRQQYSRAIRKCRTLLDEYPESDLVDDALFLMGKAHLRLKEYSDAIRNFDNVLVNFPNSEFVEETMYLKSLAHLGRGEEKVGLEWFARLRESFPEGRFGAEALFRLGDAYAEDERLDAAAEYYRQFLERYPDRPEAERVKLSLARVLVEAGRSAEAVATLEDFDAEQVTQDAAFDARRLRVVALLEEDRPEDAEPRLDALFESAGSDEQRDETQLLRGRTLLQLGRIDEGVTVLEDLASQRSGQPVASEALAIVVEYFAREFGPDSEELAEAIESTEGVRLGGEWGQRIRQRKAQIEEHDALVARVEAADSTSAAAAFELAEMALFSFERPEDAVGWYEQVLELGPDTAFAPRAAYALGYVHAEMLDEPGTAEQAHALLRERYPESPQARALAGEVFTEAKERTREEIEAMLAASGTGVQGGSAAGDGLTRTDDLRMLPTRSLRFGGPGALTPRERGGR